jgi:hypothetical protein
MAISFLSSTFVIFSITPAQSTYRGRGEIGGVHIPSKLERTLQLCVIVDIIKEGWCAPPPSPAWDDFTLLMKCTPLPLCVLYGPPLPVFVLKGRQIYGRRVDLNVCISLGKAGKQELLSLLYICVYSHMYIVHVYLEHMLYQ